MLYFVSGFMVINRAGVISGKKEWGIHEALFIDGKEVRVGPPPSYKSIRKKIEKKVRKVNMNQQL